MRIKLLWRVKIAPIGTRTRIVILESGALPACLFPVGTLIICRAVYLFVHCAHFIALSNPFHYTASFFTKAMSSLLRIDWWRSFKICRMNSFAFRLVANVTSKNCAYRDSNANFLSRVRRSAGLSIPGRDTDCMSCSVFICALRSLYSALKSIPLHYALACKSNLFNTGIYLVQRY